MMTLLNIKNEMMKPSVIHYYHITVFVYTDPNISHYFCEWADIAFHNRKQFHYTHTNLIIRLAIIYNTPQRLDLCSMKNLGLNVLVKISAFCSTPEICWTITELTSTLSQTYCKSVATCFILVLQA